MFTYVPEDVEFAYNIKWTILSHIRYMLNYRQVFEDLPNKILPESHLYDSLSDTYNNLPAFGIDYIGKRSPDEQGEDLFAIKFISRGYDVSPGFIWGNQTLNRLVLKIHDFLMHNFSELSRGNNLIIYDFGKISISPEPTSTSFSMRLIESSIDRGDIDAKRGSFDMVYSILTNI
jgi:hypothetical protein